MMRQPEPTVVMPPPPAVPREMVTYSRTVVSAPMVQRVGSPAYFRSCGATPRQANGWTVAPEPRVRWPSRTTCEMRRQFSPRTTLAPTVHHGPTVQDAGISAPGETMAVGWMGIARRAGTLLSAYEDELAGRGFADHATRVELALAGVREQPGDRAVVALDLAPRTRAERDLLTLILNSASAQLDLRSEEHTSELQ